MVLPEVVDVGWFSDKPVVLRPREHPHAEIGQVWPRDGYIRLVGSIAGLTTDRPPASATLALVVRGDEQVELRIPATLTAWAFDVAVDIHHLAATCPTTSAKLIWDVFLDAAGVAHRLRVGRHLDGIQKKKTVITFPPQTAATAGRPITVTPYYTEWNNLSLRCHRAAR